MHDLLYLVLLVSRTDWCNILPGTHCLATGKSKAGVPECPPRWPRQEYQTAGPSGSGSSSSKRTPGSRRYRAGRCREAWDTLRVGLPTAGRVLRCFLPPNADDFHSGAASYHLPAPRPCSLATQSHGLQGCSAGSTTLWSGQSWPILRPTSTHHTLESQCGSPHAIPSIRTRVPVAPGQLRVQLSSQPILGDPETVLTLPYPGIFLKSDPAVSH